MEDDVECRLLLDLVVSQRAAVLELLAREDQALLVRRDALLILDPRRAFLQGRSLQRTTDSKFSSRMQSIRTTEQRRDAPTLDYRFDFHALRFLQIP